MDKQSEDIENENKGLADNSNALGGEEKVVKDREQKKEEKDEDKDDTDDSLRLNLMKI